MGSRHTDGRRYLDLLSGINCTHDTVLRFLPPYILTEKEVDKAITGLKKVFKTVKH